MNVLIVEDDEAIARLMDLSILNHKEFLLQNVRADLLLNELAQEEEYVLTEKM